MSTIFIVAWNIFGLNQRVREVCSRRKSVRNDIEMKLEQGHEEQHLPLRPPPLEENRDYIPGPELSSDAYIVSNGIRQSSF